MQMTADVIAQNDNGRITSASPKQVANNYDPTDWYTTLEFRFMDKEYPDRE